MILYGYYGIMICWVEFLTDDPCIHYTHGFNWKGEWSTLLPMKSRSSDVASGPALKRLVADDAVIIIKYMY